ncbi:MAG: M14-type cytosolic carboxypeptidase [Pseudomonadota bacterium]
MKISSSFDGGNISCRRITSPQDIQLEILKDHNSDFYQWFYFRLTGAADQDCQLKIVNAGGAAYTAGWEGYQAAASYDRDDWFRVPTSFDGETLTISHCPQRDSVYYAYFAPYSMERHADLIADCLDDPRVRLSMLGNTLDGQDLDLLEVASGEAQGRKICWLIARQHPGETMAEWWMEGFLDRLLQTHDPIARALLEKAVFYIVPNMNPDGSRRGHLRTNAAGANLNREWDAPTLDRSPEVFHVLNKMKETSVDFLLDVHGDEALPYNFIAGTEGIPSHSQRLENLNLAFQAALRRACPDFQSEKGYGRNRPKSGNLSMAGNAIAETFDCLAMTLEQPFKDSAITPDTRVGWSPERCRKLGAASLDALFSVLDQLR